MQFLTLVVVDAYHGAVNNIFIKYTGNEMVLKIFRHALETVNEDQCVFTDLWYSLSSTLVSEACASEMADSDMGNDYRGNAIVRKQLDLPMELVPTCDDDISDVETVDEAGQTMIKNPNLEDYMKVIDDMDWGDLKNVVYEWITNEILEN